MDLKEALKILGLNSVEGVYEDDLKKAYRRLALEKHPDKSSGSNEDFVKLREAYLLLFSKVEKRDDLQVPKVQDLTALSKDEILDKYFQDTKALQLRVENFKNLATNQIKTLTEVKDGAEDVINKFEVLKTGLRSELDQVLATLEKQVNPSFFKKFFLFFLPRMSEDEFWRKYNTQIQHFTRKDAEIDVEFFKELLTLYGSGLNDIANTITEL
jgi:curved DNA-binding protein CbpA